MEPGQISVQYRPLLAGIKKSRHGIVLAKSVPAKKYGIRTGEPVANAFRKCPNLHMEAPDHEMYHKHSRELMAFLRSYTPDIEQVSVDECYMDFTGISGRFASPVEAAFEIKDEVKKRFGFTVNIGISDVKVLAKMASDFEKAGSCSYTFQERNSGKNVAASNFRSFYGRAFQCGDIEKTGDSDDW